MYPRPVFVGFEWNPCVGVQREKPVVRFVRRRCDRGRGRRRRRRRRRLRWEENERIVARLPDGKTMVVEGADGISLFGDLRRRALFLLDFSYFMVCRLFFHRKTMAGNAAEGSFVLAVSPLVPRGAPQTWSSRVHGGRRYRR
jgi:hypothetical protein